MRIKFSWQTVSLILDMGAVNAKNGTKPLYCVLYFVPLFQEDYMHVGEIKREPDQKGGLLIKVGVSGEELRKKRRNIRDELDTSSNVLTGDEKEEMDNFLNIAGKVPSYILCLLEG